MSLLEALNWRYAARAFSEQQLDDEQVRQLLEATRLSASSYGLQPYRILVIASRQSREKLLPYSFGQTKIRDCSHLLVFAASTLPIDQQVDEYIHRLADIREQSAELHQGYASHMKSALGSLSLDKQHQWAHEQAYIALGTLLTSAALMRIDSCPMTGIDKAGYDEVLGLADKNLTTSFVCALGYRHIEDQSAQQAKVRLPLSSLVAWPLTF